MELPSPAISYNASELRRLCHRLNGAISDVQLHQGNITIHNLFSASVRAGWRSGMHEHSFYEAHLVLDGSVTYVCDAVSQRLPTGSFMLHAPHTVHELWAQDVDFTRFILWFSIEPSIDISQPSLWPLWPELLWNVRLMLDEAQAVLPNWEERAHAYLATLLSRMMVITALPVAQHDEEEAKDDARFLAALDAYLRDHLQHPTPLESIAQHLNMSTRHLSRLTRRLTNESVMERLENFRMDHAAALLAYTEQPIAQIGLQVGFPDACHFSRRFRSYFQTTPREYRRRSLLALTPERTGGK